MAEFYGSEIGNISDISLPRLWYQVKVSAHPNCPRRGTFEIVHMYWQEAICKPDSLLCDKKCNFSLPEKENTWRNSNQRVSLTCHLQRVRAVYQCQRGAGGITSSLPSPSLFWHTVMLRIFFYWPVWPVQGALLLPRPQHHLWPWLGIRDGWQETDGWIK